MARPLSSPLHRQIDLSSSPMAAATSPPPQPPPLIDPRSGYCAATKTFHSLRTPAALPPESIPLSVASYALSLLPSPLPTNPALVDAASAASILYPELLAQVRALAANLRAHAGLAEGHVIFVLAPPRLEIAVLYFALLSIGAVVAPANPLSTSAEISRLFDLARPSLAVATASTAGILPSGVPAILLDSPHFRSLLSSSSDSDLAAAAAVQVGQGDAAAILFSSGTTGLVKGAVLSHRSLIAQLVGSRHLPADVGSPAVSLLAIPLFHTFGFFAVLRSVACGETGVLVTKRYELGAALRAAAAHGVGYMPVVPPVLAAMAGSEEAAAVDLSSLRLVIVGGAPLSRLVAERFVARFPRVRIANGYGLTEAGAVAGAHNPEEMRVDAVGRIAAGMEARIIDVATGEGLPPGAQGELCLRGPTIMKGYIDNDEATASVLDVEGWLRTGDICYFDHHGFLFIVDRLKEMIKYKAYQVPPAELENILHSHPDIVDAAVIPYPQQEVGEIPMAYVVRKQGSTLSEEAVINFVSKQVTPFKKIRQVAFISSIPKSPAGKILRKELIEHALSRHQSSKL